MDVLSFSKANRLDADAILYNANDALRRWRKAKAEQDAYLAGHISNPGIYNINVIGASITEGYSGNVITLADYEKGYAKVLRNIVQAIYSDTGAGFMHNNYPFGADSSGLAWLQTGTWLNYGAYGWYYEASGILGCNTAGNTLTANFDGAGHFNGTGIALIVQKFSGGGDFTVSIDGGAAQTFSSYADDSEVAIIPVTTSDGSTPLTDGDHTCVITSTAAPFIFQGGFEIKGTSGFRVNSVAVSGAKIGGFVYNPVNYNSAIGVWSPKLTIISMIGNDFNTQTDLTTYAADWQTLITQAKAYGDVLITTLGGIFDASHTIPISSYRDICYNLALANDCAFLDVSKEWGGDYATANAAGYFADTCHPTVSGHQAAATAIAAALGIAA